MDWKEFEKYVREISADYQVAVEITQKKNQEKIRTDTAKLFAVRNTLFSQNNIYCECFIVMQSTPTDSMRNCAVLSVNEVYKGEIL